MGSAINHNAHQTLTERLAALCQEEVTCLTRPVGCGAVLPRTLDPTQKPRTAGARTAGG